MKIKRGYIVGLAFALLGVICFFFDRTILSFLTYYQNPIFGIFFSLFEEYTVFILLILGLLAVMIYKKDKDSPKKLVMSLILTILIVIFLKLLFARERPFEFIDYFPFTNIQDYSFPSNHAAIAFAILPFLLKEFKKLKYLCIVFAILAAYSRIYLGVHYLSDVIFGALIGYFTSEYMINLNNKKFKRKVKLNKKKKL